MKVMAPKSERPESRVKVWWIFLRVVFFVIGHQVKMCGRSSKEGVVLVREEPVGD